jgi:hypothetical protein
MPKQASDHPWKWRNRSARKCNTPKCGKNAAYGEAKCRDCLGDIKTRKEHESEARFG